MPSDITLGILVYNQAQFLSRLFKSIATQSNRDFNIQLLDNNSYDGSFELAKQQARKEGIFNRIKFLKNDSNTGAAEGLKRLILESQSKYVAIVHGDDYLLPNYFETVEKFSREFSSVTAFNITLQGFSESDEIEKDARIYRPLWTTSSILNALLVSGLNPGLMPGALINRQFVMSRNLLDFSEPINGVEDVLLWLRIIRSGGKIMSISEPLYRYRLHPDQFSSSNSRNSYFYGLARRLNIEESENLFLKLIAKSEIAYEVERFGEESDYIRGLGKEFANYKLFSLFRFFNILTRKVARFWPSIGYK